MKKVSLTDKELKVLDSLLNIASSGWYDDEQAKGDGFKNAQDYEDTVAKIQEKLKK